MEALPRPGEEKLHKNKVHESVRISQKTTRGREKSVWKACGSTKQQCESCCSLQRRLETSGGGDGGREGISGEIGRISVESVNSRAEECCSGGGMRRDEERTDAVLVRSHSMLANSFSRPALQSFRAAAPSSARAFSSTPVPQATLRELELRIRSVGNIGKITKSMKMVAGQSNRSHCALRPSR